MLLKVSSVSRYLSLSRGTVKEYTVVMFCAWFLNFVVLYWLFLSLARNLGDKWQQILANDLNDFFTTKWNIARNANGNMGGGKVLMNQTTVFKPCNRIGFIPFLGNQSLNRSFARSLLKLIIAIKQKNEAVKDNFHVDH